MRWQLRLLLAALLAAVVYAVLVLVADEDAVAASIARVDAGVLLLAVALGATAFAIRSLRWRLYLHRLGALAPPDGLPFGRAFAMGLASGKAGQLVKAYFLRRDAGLPYTASVPATVGERIADAYGVLALLVLALALGARGGVWPAIAVGAITLAFTLALRHGYVAALAKRLPWLREHGAIVDHAQAEIGAHLTVRELAAPIVLGLVGFLFEGLLLQALAERGLGVALPFSTCILLIALVDVAAMLTLVPGGFGVAEGGLVVALRLEGLSIADAAALTLLFRASTLWLGFALDALAAGILQLGQRKAESGGPSPARRWTRWP